MIDLVERVRQLFELPPVTYAFFNTGLEMQTTKDHVKATAEKYGVTIEEHRPKINIVQAARKYGIPFISKVFSQRLNEWMRHKEDAAPLSIIDEYERAEDKQAKYKEFLKRYKGQKSAIEFFLNLDKEGLPMATKTQSTITSKNYLRDFMREYPPDFMISARCCYHCKKHLAHSVQKDYELIITGERAAEGGVRAIHYGNDTNSCFRETTGGKYKLRPLYYVSDKDKAWYKETYGIRYSDAYEVYGMKRTGCCGCPINYRAVEDLKLIEPYEPNVVKAAWNIFGKSYEYRQKYNEYKAERKRAKKEEI